MKLILLTFGLGIFITTLGEASAQRRPHRGPKGDCCEWTDWQDRDNPSGRCDCEEAPDDCKVGCSLRKLLANRGRTSVAKM